MRSILFLYNLFKSPRALLLIFMCILLLFIAFGGLQLISASALRSWDADISSYTFENIKLLMLLYLVLTLIFSSFSSPGVFIFPLIGGFMFGTMFSAFFSALMISIGTMITYEISGRIAGDDTQNRLHLYMDDINRGFYNHGKFYLTMIRITHDYPKWVLHLIPKMMKLKKNQAFFATLLSYAPFSYALSCLGDTVRQLLQMDTLSKDAILIYINPLFSALSSVFLLVALPIAIKYWCSFRAQKGCSQEKL